MRLLFLAPHPFFQNRGTPIADRRLLEFLTRQGYEVHLLTLPEGEDVEMPGLTIHRLPRIPGLPPVPPGLSFQKVAYDVLLLWKALRLRRQIRPDLVHAVEEAALIGTVLKFVSGTPYVYDMDSSLPEQLTEKRAWLRVLRPILTKIERIMVRQAAGVLAVCSELGADAREHGGNTFIQVAEDTSPVEPEAREAADDLRHQFRLPGPLVLYVGNLEWYQGIDLLIDAFEHVANQHDSATLVIVGGRETDIVRYGQICARRSLQDRIRLAGRRPVAQLNSLLEQADVLVSPRTAGRNTPMKVFAYMESGVPIVATRRPTHTQVLDDTSAVLVEPDAAAFAEGILRLLYDGDFAACMGRAVRKRFEEQYSPPAAEEKHRRFFGAMTRLLPHLHA